MDPSKSKFHKINKDKFIEKTFEFNNDQLADLFKVDEKTIRRWKLKLEKDGNIVGNAYFPKITEIKYDDYIRTTLDSYVVFGDCEHPFVDTTFLELIYEVAKKYKIKHCFINGDFIDFNSLSYWPRSTPKLVTLVEEIEPALNNLKIFTSVFDNIYYLQANHERRLNLRTSGELNVGMFVKDILGVTFSEYSYAVNETSGKKPVRISHPKNYSINVGTVSKKLAYKFNSNIILGHDHLVGFKILEDGCSWILHHGCCRKPETAEFLMMVDNTMPMWTQGFCLVVKGQPLLITRDNVEFYLSK